MVFDLNVPEGESIWITYILKPCFALANLIYNVSLKNNPLVHSETKLVLLWHRSEELTFIFKYQTHPTSTLDNRLMS